MAKKQQSKTLRVGDLQYTDIDSVKPYWNNPRRVTEEAVAEVADSIREYGYRQPVLVDQDYIIITGHVRYSALRRLGEHQIPVLVSSMSKDRAKEYRLVDNRSAEFTMWDPDLLAQEMQQLGDQVAEQVFPEMDLNAGTPQEQQEQVVNEEWGKVDTTVPFICPHCYHSWEGTVSRDEVLAGHVPAPERSE